MMRDATRIGLDAVARGRRQGQETLHMFEAAQQAIADTRQLLELMSRQLGALEGPQE